MALITAVLASVLLSCLGVALVLLGSAETTLAGRDAQAQAAGHAAEGVLTLAMSELRALPSWTEVVSAGPADTCARTGRFVDVSGQPRAPWDGSPIDLHALTMTLRAAAGPPGGTPPVWRLFEYGPINRLVPSEPRRYPFYAVVWAADGGGGGGVVRLHTAVLGPFGTVSSLEASVARRSDGTSLTRLAIRAVN